MKRFLVMLYPSFCNFEIAALTEILAFQDDWEMTTVAAESKVYTGEDSMAVLAQKDFSQVNLLDYELLILPGIDDYHVPLSDARNAVFLSQLKTAGKRPIIAAMSSSPILLAKAGLLADTKFTGGIFEETYEKNPFIPKQNLIRQPVVSDNGIISSSFQFFREFAIIVARACGIKIGDSFLEPARTDRPYTAEELTYHFEG
ncbi:DJ-1/PfpI family protein [Levilactobacillus parabrevis]|uniref:DJ-1/PfpI family protein n=1 Tax=Levilactobacillus parabrevis TaxID=357278 RepID=UPI0021A3C56D|nr:DJ-1/PfpI family protein [Levilactobacillus parabrevis]MCT4487900.1 4-methyl-5(B-hydroxyethyl)-thiazole monophosphate biosynthesis protein [Levilactobacillus parabrevis]MCT4491234.1 4-methyl-5(B-hydroxyethyl)-thiazole monophosphate biosynthesis protein [Levilactobacillus parabrevis]